MREAVYAGTRNLYGAMVPAVKSLVANSAVDRIHLLIEDGEFPYELPDLVEVHDVSGQTFFRPDGPNMRGRYTYMAMMRAALCHVLEGDKVLSLDVDTIAVRDCTAVWDIPLEGCYFAASREPHRMALGNGFMYCNTGVALYNLSKLRDGKADEVIEVLNTARYEWMEQDLFNYLCQGRIAEMDGRYNWCDFTVHAYDPIIRHFAAVQDWHLATEYLQYRHLSWDEAMDRHARIVRRHA